jgi:pimeloyl-ACP methyl ester carboxylesterase
MRDRTTARLTLLLLLLPAALAAAAPAAATGRDGTLASADGVPIRYHLEGAPRPGQPTLVFVHCWSCDRHLWDEQVAHLAPRFQVVTLDLAGHGDSGRDRKEWTIPRFAGDVRVVVQGLGLDPVILIGHSMGGSVVVAAAREMPRRLAGIVLVDTLLDVDARREPKEIADFLAPLRADYRTAVERFVRGALLAPSTDPRLADRIVREAAARPPEIAIPALESAFAYDARPALRELRVPIHAINGTRYPTRVEAFRRAAPQFAVSYLPGTGHYLMLEAPQRFDEILDRTLAEMAPPRPPA